MCPTPSDFSNWNGRHLEIKGQQISILPDPHLGRRFINDVPLHRRGEREQMVMEEFRKHMAQVRLEKPLFHVCVGDLFDKPTVDNGVVLTAARIYRTVAASCPNTCFVVLAGNHDVSRDEDRTNSFDVFLELLTRPGLDVLVLRKPVPHWIGRGGVQCMFYPWGTNVTAWPVQACGAADVAFGHWDVVAIGENENLVPAEDLAKIVPLVVTGHDHRCRVLDKQWSVPVLVTGSMLPYAHGEDLTGETYRTVTLPELAELGPERVKNMCLRVLLNPGEELPADLDALQIKMLRAGQPEDGLDLAVDPGGFDLQEIMSSMFSKHGVRSDLAASLMEKHRELRT